MGRPKSKGAYAPLAAQYYLDDSILEAGPAAELMWVRLLSFLASVPTDGFITERQIRMVGIGLRDWRQRVATLQVVGLLTAVSGGYTARSWSKWNRSTELQNRLLATDRERKAQKPAVNADNSDRKTGAFQSDSDDQNSREQSSREQETTSSSDASGADVVAGGSDVVDLCNLLAELVRANGHPVNTVGKTWWQSCERLMRIDGYTAEQVAVIIRWATADEFWSTNIRSMPTLREKFSTLRAQRNRTLGAKPGRKTKDEQIVDVLELGRRLQEEDDRKALGA